MNIYRNDLEMNKSIRLILMRPEMFSCTDNNVFNNNYLIKLNIREKLPIIISTISCLGCMAVSVITDLKKKSTVYTTFPVST